MKGNSSEGLAGETGERRRKENTPSGLRQLKEDQLSQVKPEAQALTEQSVEPGSNEVGHSFSIQGYWGRWCEMKHAGSKPPSMEQKAQEGEGCVEEP